MQQIDYSKYTIEDLNDVLRHIDRESFPERVLEVEHHLRLKLDDPELVAKESSKSNFFNAHVPSKLVTSIWLRCFGWGILCVVGTIPFLFILGIILAAFGASEYWIKSLALVFYWLITIPLSWVVVRKVIGSKFSNYEISITKKEN